MEYPGPGSLCFFHFSFACGLVAYRLFFIKDHLVLCKYIVMFLR